MTNNDTLRSLRYLLDVNDAKIAEIIALGDGATEAATVTAMLKEEGTPGFISCSHDLMARFLNGLVIYKRGKDDSRPPQPVEVPVTNNIVLKRMRVAFELKDSDLISLLATTGFAVSKSELSALFRRPDHRNYRECGDQLLRNLLKALSGVGVLSRRAVP